MLCYIQIASSLLISREVFRKYQRRTMKTRMIMGSAINTYGLAADATAMMAMKRSSNYKIRLEIIYIHNSSATLMTYVQISIP